MNGIPLGRKVRPPERYDPSVLFRIERRKVEGDIFGYDLWRCYEMSWLNERGRPHAGILEIAYPSTSAFIVESKSLKLYLAGISCQRFPSKDTLVRVIASDIERTVEAQWIQVRIEGPEGFGSFMPVPEIPAESLDSLDIAVERSGPDAGLITCTDGYVEEALCTDLLKTVCPITGQPDWASVLVRYRGRPMDREGLLHYLCSYRGHAGFSEDVCTLIYTDIARRCRPDELGVTCFYTRRGGIDITARRQDRPASPGDVERIRLVRQ